MDDFGKLKSAYLRYVDTYRGGDGRLPPMMQLKLEHTMKVLDAAEKICEGESFDPETRLACRAAALLHDTGRYEQLKLYDTFRDSDSVDHAVFSHDIVSEKGWLEGWKAKDSILAAVLYHNRREIPAEGMDALTLACCKVVRDADKLDIFRVLEDQVANTDWRNDSRAFWNLKTDAPPNPVVVGNVLRGESVAYQDIKCLADFVLIQVGWMISGLEYPTSRLICAQRGHLAFRRDFMYQLTADPSIDTVCLKAEKILAKEKIAALVRDTSSTIPEDVRAALSRARDAEDGAAARAILDTILENCEVAANARTPLCQDTGILTFFVDRSLAGIVDRDLVADAVRHATSKGWLRKNCIDPLDGKSYDDNVSTTLPVVKYTDLGGRKIILLMKGGGSENMSRQYSLPDASLGAGRDLDGVEECIVDAALEAQGYGCAPGVLGVAIGGDRSEGYAKAKEQLLRDLGDEASDPRLAALERSALSKINSLGIGPMGLGGRTTALAVKAAALSRVPASYFVTVAYMCWALRRRSVEI